MISAEIAVAAVAVLASGTTAVVSMVVAYRSQRSAIREQNLWQERTNTYLKLQGWIHAIYEWDDRGHRNDPPSPDLDTVMRVRLFASPFIVDHFAQMERVIDLAVRARRDKDWETFDNLRRQMSVGFAVDLNALLRDELRGHPNEYVATPSGRIRLRWRKRQALRFWVLKQRLRGSRAVDLEMPEGGTTP
ncbi:hypothetical protein [Mycolicibacterium farcinogenes]|uniref:Uncharacterized protein n=1 Tax=Mycolicibacterium farcinogenes TaxID=1802 RepID=A0ACD1FDK1_MYCFR|nr:hypothetical protein [Mycolicibacterium farcinogenes]QZH65017.1 hypothetical protein K6L26_23900 [Mycolicibacterium farcinogenes]